MWLAWRSSAGCVSAKINDILTPVVLEVSAGTGAEGALADTRRKKKRIRPLGVSILRRSVEKAARQGTDLKQMPSLLAKDI